MLSPIVLDIKGNVIHNIGSSGGLCNMAEANNWRASKRKEISVITFHSYKLFLIVERAIPWCEDSVTSATRQSLRYVVDAFNSSQTSKDC